MQRFWWPGFEMQLLEQLQRQQNSARFCDTLLQTEGISVPTHSCVLAALSPYLSQRLSESPSPPLGQKRHLHLQDVTAQTLLKLVGLLYSGKMEVRSSKEQNDVLAAAHKFGISGLVLGCRDKERRVAELPERRQRADKGEATESRKSLKMQDARVRTERSRRGEADPLGNRRFESVGTQTVHESLMSVAGLLSDQTSCPSPETAASVATLSTSLQSQNTTQFPPIPHPTNRTDAESTTGQSSDCSTRRSFSSAPSIYAETSQTSLSHEASSPGTHERNISKQSSESGEGVSERERPGREDGGNAAQLRDVCRERKETINSQCFSRGKNLQKMEQMMDAAQVPVKMKLKRKTNRELWHIVGDEEETVSVLPASKQRCPSNETLPAGLPVVQTSDHPVLPVPNAEAAKLQPVFTSSPQPLRHANTSSDSEARSNSRLSMNQSSELESESLSPPRAPLEESNEVIKQLMEDIITCFNIELTEDGGKETHPDHGGEPTFSKVPAAENGLGSTPLDAGFVFYQDFGRADSHYTTDTAAIHYTCRAQNQPGYADPSAVHSALQQHQPSEFTLSIRSLSPVNGWSCAGEGGSPYPVTCFSSGQKLHCSTLEPPFSQEHQNIEFLSQSHESDAQSADGLSLQCMQDLNVPPCLSPLPPCPHTSARPSVLPPPWLTEAACTLQFPLGAIPAGKSAFQARATSGSCSAGKPPRCELFKPQNGGEAGSLKSAGERETKSNQKKKCGPRKRKKKAEGNAEDSTPIKRKRGRCPKSEKSRGLTLDSISSEVRGAAKTVCAVSLSCKNVLIKEREKTVGSPRKPCKASTAVRTKKSREATSLGREQNRIRTRGFVKRTQRNTSNGISDNCCVLIPVIRRAVVVQKQDPLPPKRKPGRPRKIKLENKPSENVDGEVSGRKEADMKQPEKGALQGDVKRCRARVDEAGQKTMRPERCGKKETDDIKSNEKQKQSMMVTLKEFRNLIKRKHSKTRKGTKVQDGNKPVDGGDADERREEADGSDAEMGENGGAKILRQALSEATVDENNNLVPQSSAAQCKPTQHDVMSSSGTRKSNTGHHGDQPASSWEALEKEVAMLLSERKQSATSHDQGADYSSTLAGCSRKDDDEEVDVMLYSPDKGSSTREIEERLVVIPDEEEEDDDVAEIDVTGDEAE